MSTPTTPSTPVDSAPQTPIKGKGKAERDGKRKEGFRAKKSTGTDEANKKALFDQLLFGFKHVNNAMLSMQIVATPRSVILPVSTRATGFIVRFLISKFARLQIRQLQYHQFCCALYRVSLLSFDIKVMQSMANQTSKNIGRGMYRDIDINIDFVRILGELGAGFSPLINLFSSIGVFKGFGTNYIPRIALPSAANQVVTWDPTLVTFSSLRLYVMALRNEATPQAVRQYFYDHSPFPNARWNQPQRVRDADGQLAIKAGFPVLQNADEIMPDNYGLNDLRADVNVIMDSIEIIGRKYEKYIHMGRLDFNSNGDASQLVSNEVGDIRCSDLGTDVNYAMTLPLQGTIELFWSAETVSDPEFYMGVLHLLGELPSRPTLRSTWNPRSIDVSKSSSDVDYSGCITNLLG